MTYSKNELVVTGGGTGGRVFVRLPDTRVVRNTEPTDVVCQGVDQRSGLGVVPFGDVLIHEGCVTKPLVESIGRVDGELVRKELVTGKKG